MKLLKQLLVPISNDKRIHVKSARAKRKKYVRYFRNSDGKPRNKAKSIGKLSSKPRMWCQMKTISKCTKCHHSSFPSVCGIMGMPSWLGKSALTLDCHNV